MKARVTVWSPDSQGELTTPPQMFEDKLRFVVSQVLEENGLTSSEFCLFIQVCLSTTHWIGRRLYSPIYSLDSLDDTVLKLWRSFCVGRGVGGLLFRCSPMEAKQTWERVRDIYVAAWAQRGADVRIVRERLDGLEVAYAPRRVIQMERRESARVRAMMVADARARLKERREEMRERVAMRREDLRREIALVSDRLGRLAALWARELETVRRRQEMVRARDLRRALHVQRERRWRWLRRQDLTMEEILRGWSSDK
eukprot:TRINITY_DN6803_c0_g1_i1.p1 TRINITY_DN6803_c0_g1~~TRINITY_DN6803_c0_g1_i1.p1  ORF type:complete len:286 (+),score=28.81 TRINITY_DN6803_c0_g1_i1:95-859(+)